MKKIIYLIVFAFSLQAFAGGEYLYQIDWKVQDAQLQLAFENKPYKALIGSGKKAVLIWSVQCSECIEKIDIFNKLATKLKKLGYTAYSFMADDEIPNLRSFKRQTKREVFTNFKEILEVMQNYVFLVDLDRTLKAGHFPPTVSLVLYEDDTIKEKHQGLSSVEVFSKLSGP